MQTAVAETPAPAAILNEFVTVTETILPGGTVVPSFQVGKYATSKSDDSLAIVTAGRKPWHSISHTESIEAARQAGYNLITETQYLAIAYQIYHQDENWTGGKVGQGELFRGLHRWNVNEAQEGLFESSNPIERRWHVLANGERVYDFSGNIYSWVFDDVQGDENGVIAKPFAEDSPTRTTAPCASRTNGIGDTSLGDGDWSGHALFRGGCWGSGGYAGVFGVASGGPSSRRGRVGFRVTKSL